MSTEKRTEETGSYPPPASSLDVDRRAVALDKWTKKVEELSDQIANTGNLCMANLKMYQIEAESQSTVSIVGYKNQKLRCTTIQGDQALREQRIPHNAQNMEESSMYNEKSASDVLSKSFSILQNANSQPYLQPIQNVSGFDKKRDLMSSENKVSNAGVSANNEEISAACSNVNTNYHYQQQNFATCSINFQNSQPTHYQQKQYKSSTTVDDRKWQFKVLPRDIYLQRMAESRHPCPIFTPEQLPVLGYGIPSGQYSEVSTSHNYCNSTEIMKWLNSIEPPQDETTSIVKTPKDMPCATESIGGSFSGTSLKKSVLPSNNMPPVQIDTTYQNERSLPSYKHLSSFPKFIGATKLPFIVNHRCIGSMPCTSIEPPTGSYSGDLGNKSEFQCDNKLPFIVNHPCIGSMPCTSIEPPTGSYSGDLGNKSELQCDNMLPVLMVNETEGQGVRSLSSNKHLPSHRQYILIKKSPFKRLCMQPPFYPPYSLSANLFGNASINCELQTGENVSTVETPQIFFYTPIEPTGSGSRTLVKESRFQSGNKPGVQGMIKIQDQRVGLLPPNKHLPSYFHSALTKKHLLEPLRVEIPRYKPPFRLSDNLLNNAGSGSLLRTLPSMHQTELQKKFPPQVQGQIRIPLPSGSFQHGLIVISEKQPQHAQGFVTMPRQELISFTNLQSGNQQNIYSQIQQTQLLNTNHYVPQEVLTQNQERLQESAEINPQYGRLIQQSLFQIPQQQIMQQNLLKIAPQQETLRVNQPLKISQQNFVNNSLRELKQSLVNSQQRLSQVVPQDDQLQETLHRDGLQIASQQQEGTSQNFLQYVSQSMNRSRLMIQIASQLQELSQTDAQERLLNQGFFKLASQQQGSVVGTPQEEQQQNIQVQPQEEQQQNVQALPQEEQQQNVQALPQEEQQQNVQALPQEEQQQNVQALPQEEQQQNVQVQPQEEPLQKPHADYPVPHNILQKCQSSIQKTANEPSLALCYLQEPLKNLLPQEESLIRDSQEHYGN